MTDDRFRHAQSMCANLYNAPDRHKQLTDGGRRTVQKSKSRNAQTIDDTNRRCDPRITLSSSIIHGIRYVCLLAQDLFPEFPHEMNYYPAANHTG